MRDKIIDLLIAKGPLMFDEIVDELGYHRDNEFSAAVTCYGLLAEHIVRIDNGSRYHLNEIEVLARL